MVGRTLWKARPGGKAEEGELEAPSEQSEGVRGVTCISKMLEENVKKAEGPRSESRLSAVSRQAWLRQH